MFGSKRRRYNGDVAALLPAFGIDMDEAGMFKVLQVLDAAWGARFNVYEGALLVGYSFASGLFQSGEGERAKALHKERLLSVQQDWIKKGIVKADLANGMSEKLTKEFGLN